MNYKRPIIQRNGFYRCLSRYIYSFAIIRWLPASLARAPILWCVFVSVCVCFTFSLLHWSLFSRSSHRYDHRHRRRCHRRRCSRRRRQFYGFHQPLLNAIKVEPEDIQPTKQETNK